MIAKTILGSLHRVQSTCNAFLHSCPQGAKIFHRRLGQGLRSVELGMGKTVGHLVGAGDEVNQNFGDLSQHHQLFGFSFPADLFQRFARAGELLLFTFETVARERTDRTPPSAEFTGSNDARKGNFPSLPGPCISELTSTVCPFTSRILFGLIDHSPQKGGDGEDRLGPASRRRPPVQWLADQLKWGAVDGIRHIDVDHGLSLALLEIEA